MDEDTDMSKTVFRIEAPHFVAGIVVWGSAYLKNGEMVSCHRAAPIVSYMDTWSLGKIKRYCIQKGWKYRYWRGEG